MLHGDGDGNGDGGGDDSEAMSVAIDGPERCLQVKECRCNHTSSVPSAISSTDSAGSRDARLRPLLFPRPTLSDVAVRCGFLIRRWSRS